MTRVFLVEDDTELRSSMEALLRSNAYSVTSFATAEDAEPKLLGPLAEPPDLLILDVRLGKMSGVDLVQRLSDADRLPPTLVVSGAATAAEAVAAIRLGVVDYLEKPFTRERLLQSINVAMRLAGLEKKVNHLEARTAPLDRLLGESAAMVELKGTINKLMGTEARVLILGESGTGKELIAEALHYGSKRRDQEFLKINCGALSPHLVESELFGHRAGAFTDARSDRAGLFEAADGGTLFLDEIGDLELGLQQKLLRVLEENTIRRVGDNVDRTVDVRILAATHQPLGKDSENFRSDLYYRLAHVPLQVPPLRERSSDVVLLTEHFLNHFAQRHGRSQPELEPAVYGLLEGHSWPGNVRELRGLCERIVLLGGQTVSASALRRMEPALGSGSQSPEGPSTNDQRSLTLRGARAEFEKAHILEALNQADWNFTAAAESLDVRRTYLHAKARQLGIQRPE